MDKSRDYTITAVKKALEILRILGEQNGGLTLSALSIMSNIGKSSMLRLLYTLVNEGFVVYDEQTKKYSLGIEMFRLGTAKYNSLDIFTIARKHLRKLSDQTNMICYLGVRQGDMLAMLERVLPTSVPVWTQLMIQPGGTSELYSTGIGRLFLAQLPDSEVIEYLERTEIKKFTDDTVTDKLALLELVRQARKERFSGTIGENESYIYSLCAPVYGCNGEMEAGISLCGLKDMLYSSRYEDYVKTVCQTARNISQEIGYSPQ